MMKKIVLMLVLSCSLIGHSQEEVDISKMQIRDEIIYVEDIEKPFTGKIIEKFENGQIKNEVEYKNGIRHGVYKNYREDGQLTIDNTYENGKMTSTRHYNGSGQLSWEMVLQENSKVEKSYYENGQLAYEETLVEGMRNGTVKTYYENGQLKSESTPGEDNNVQFIKNYYESGQLTSEETLVDGVKNGLTKSYHENGQLAYEGFLVNDLWNGIVKTYYENGQLRTETSIVMGVLHGDTNVYSESGELVGTFVYENDEIVQSTLHE